MINRYDVIDWTRQFLENVAPTIHAAAVDGFMKKNMTALKVNSDRFMDLLADTEELLSTDSRFMLGTWLEMAKAIGTTDAEKALYEYNARNQVKK